MIRIQPGSSFAITFFLVSFLVSCKPRIYFFNVNERETTSADSLRFHWKVRGEPTLMFDRIRIASPPDDSLDILEFTLSVKKNGIDSSRKLQVVIRATETSDRVVIPVESLSGDTIIARGMKDRARWENFKIIGLINVMRRPLLVFHSGVSAVFADSGAVSTRWKDLSYSGDWEIRARMTDEEKKNHHLIPDRFEVGAIIQKK